MFLAIQTRTLLIRHTRNKSTSITNLPHLYNSLSKTMEPLPPVYDPETGKRRPLTWYSCGPTVYDDTHLGHARSYVSTDILRRAMTNFFGYNIYYVLGMTDVDDKIVNRSNLLGVSAQYLARKHEREFFEDLEALNCDSPNTITRVTEHISDIIQYIQTIIDNGNAYELEDGIYFDVSSLGDQYGQQLGSPDSRRINGGNETNKTNKKDRRDFALWKKINQSQTNGTNGTNGKDGTDGKENDKIVVWESPWGTGRPGWHIECSAMTNTVLGKSFDLHSGGIDLCFPHHCNEVAQANAFNQSNEWVSMFLHTGHLHIDGLKMSKSLKNFITVRQMLEIGDGLHKDGLDKDQDSGSGLDENENEMTTDLQAVLNGVDVRIAFRMFVLSYHYRSNITYSLDRMRDASVDVKRFTSFLNTMETYIAAQQKKMFIEEEEEDNNNQAVAIIDDRDRNRKEQHSFFTALQNQIDQEIHDALANDMNTPKVLSILRDMCSKVRIYMKEQNDLGFHVSAEYVQNACRNVTFTFERLGLELRPTKSTSSGMDQNNDSSDSEKEVVQAFASFRALVRDAARRKANPGELFQMCDDIRDVVGPKIGWEFVDGGNDDDEVRKR